MPSPAQYRLWRARRKIRRMDKHEFTTIKRAFFALFVFGSGKLMEVPCYAVAIALNRSEAEIQAIVERIDELPPQRIRLVGDRDSGSYRLTHQGARHLYALMTPLWSDKLAIVTYFENIAHVPA